MGKILEIIILVAKIIAMLVADPSLNVRNVVEEIAYENSIEFYELWNRVPSKYK